MPLPLWVVKTLMVLLQKLLGDIRAVVVYILTLGGEVNADILLPSSIALP